MIDTENKCYLVCMPWDDDLRPFPVTKRLCVECGRTVVIDAGNSAIIDKKKMLPVCTPCFVASGPQPAPDGIAIAGKLYPDLKDAKRAMEDLIDENDGNTKDNL